jgi:type I pantothenate kinase
MRNKMDSPYQRFERNEWAALRNNISLPLTEEEIINLQGINEHLSPTEVTEIYLPLSRLLNLYVAAIQGLHKATSSFLGSTTSTIPYIIGIAGSVAVGKSTTARVLQALLSRWPNHPKVDLITTDGFLYPNRVLEEKGLMQRKGFPESYDIRGLIRFIREVKAGVPKVTAPVYSHLSYDILQDKVKIITQPDILIVEGINVLQTPKRRNIPQVFVSDFFDFSIYVNATEEDIARWYVERFLVLRDTAFQNPDSYFHRYGSLSLEEAKETAYRIWKEINAVNLYENILPTKYRADLILEKSQDHTVQSVQLRKL